MSNTEKAFAFKIINDMEKVLSNVAFTSSFEIIPTVTNETNTSPVYRIYDRIGFDSWAIKYVVPYAYQKLIENQLEKPVDIEILRPCILALNLLHPEMPTAWNKRRELVLSKRVSSENDMRLTALVLSRAPNCNEALSYRRWLLKNNLVTGQYLLRSEFTVVVKSGDRHHCNYHAWSHWSWCTKHFAPKNTSCIIPSAKEVAFMSFKDFNLLYKTSPLGYFITKLNENTIFLSKHVSDYSAAFNRIHVIQEILENLENGVGVQSTGNFDNEDHEIIEAVHNVDLGSDDDDDDEVEANEPYETAFDLFKSFKKHVYDVLQGSEDANIIKYIYKNKINVRLGFLLKDLKFNELLIKVFDNIEALLYLRRFLIFTVNNLLFKPNAGARLKIVLSKLYDNVIASEKAYVECLREDTRYYMRVIENYDRWLKRIIFKEECNPRN